MSRQRSSPLRVRLGLIPIALTLATGVAMVSPAPGQTTRPPAGQRAKDADEPHAGGPATARTPRAVLTVRGDRFLLDGGPFDMWGIRTASGTQDDA